MEPSDRLTRHAAELRRIASQIDAQSEGNAPSLLALRQIALRLRSLAAALVASPTTDQEE